MRTPRTWRLGMTLALAPTALWACQAAPGTPPSVGGAFQLAPAPPPGAASSLGLPGESRPEAGAGSRPGDLPADGGGSRAGALPEARPALPAIDKTATGGIASTGGGAASGGGSSGAGGAAATAPATTGALTVDVGRALQAARPAQRRLLATTADIDHVVVILRMPNHADRMQVVTQAQVSAGATSVTFSGLPAGTATLIVTAFDGVGTALGTGTQAATVAVGQTTALALDVAIDPAVVANAAGGGSVAVALSFSNGPAATAAASCPTPAGTVVASWPMPAWGLYADGQGRLCAYHWQGIAPGNADTNGVAVVHRASAADGAPIDEAIVDAWFGATAFGRVAIRAGGLAYAPTSGTLWYPGTLEASAPGFSPTGGGVACTIIDGTGAALFPTVAAVPDAGAPSGLRAVYRLARRTGAADPVLTGMTGHRAVARDAAGNIWADWVDDAVAPPTNQASLRKYAPDESLAGTFALPATPVKLEADAAGAVWVATTATPPSPGSMIPPGDALHKVAPDGTVLTTLATPVADFCLDGNGALWVATGAAVRKYTQDGTLAGETAIAATAVTFGGGYVFVGDTPSFLASNVPSTVTKIAP